MKEEEVLSTLQCALQNDWDIDTMLAYATDVSPTMLMLRSPKELLDDQLNVTFRKGMFFLNGYKDSKPITTRSYMNGRGLIVGILTYLQEIKIEKEDDING